MSAPLRALPLLVLALVAGVVPAAAHDRVVQQMVLFLDAPERVTGELTLDPHNGPLSEVPRGTAHPRVSPPRLAAVAAAIHLEVDGREQPVTVELRELWQPAGATAGDVCVFSSPELPGLHTVRVRVEQALVPLVVTVRHASAERRAVQFSTLLTAPGATPVYTRSAPTDASAGWQPGGAERFRQQWQAASGSEPAAPAPPGGSLLGWDTASSFIQLGFRHVVLEGYDHVLFVLALSIGALVLRRLLWIVTGFTLAHSLSLFLAQWFGWVPPAALVEPIIALSIVVAAVQLALGTAPVETAARELQSNAPALRPERASAPRGLLRRASSPESSAFLVLGFGLVHGLGFSGTLGQLALTPLEHLVSVASFNVGVELGQLVFVVLGYGAMAMLRGQPRRQRQARRVSGYAIAALGVWLLLDRLLA